MNFVRKTCCDVAYDVTSEMVERKTWRAYERSSHFLTRWLERAIIFYYGVVSKTSFSLASFYSNAMIRVVDKSLKRCDELLNRLEVDETNCEAVFAQTCNDLLILGPMNWGRIIIMYVVASHIAYQLFQKRFWSNARDDAMDIRRVVAFIDYAGSFVADKSWKWISENGGWHMFQIKYGKPRAVCRPSSDAVGTAILAVAVGAAMYQLL